MQIPVDPRGTGPLGLQRRHHMPTYGIAGRITCMAAFAALVTGSADTASAQSACAKLWFRVAADGAKPWRAR